VTAVKFDGKQIIAGVGGTLALAVAARYTFGGALIAASGMAIAGLIARRRRRPLSRPGSWVGAVAAVAVALVLLVGGGLTMAPKGTLSGIKRAMDTTKVEQKPPPAWLERLAPGAAARANRPPIQLGEGFEIWALVMGSLIGIGMLAGFVGSVGWVASLPLAYAITGHWIGAKPEDALSSASFGPDENHPAE